MTKSITSNNCAEKKNKKLIIKKINIDNKKYLYRVKFIYKGIQNKKKILLKNKSVKGSKFNN